MAEDKHVDGLYEAGETSGRAAPVAPAAAGGTPAAAGASAPPSGPVTGADAGTEAGAGAVARAPASALGMLMGVAGRPLTRADIRRGVMALAGPALAEQILVTLMHILNMVMVSRLGAAATAAVGLSNQPIFFATAGFMALNVGTTAVVARSVGAGEPQHANAAARQALIMTAAIAVVLSTIGAVFARHVLLFMGAGPDVIAAGRSYFVLSAIALAFNGLGMCLSAVLRGAGDTVTPMRINVLADVLVVVIGLPLIYGFFGLPRLGVAGAGVASIVARVASAAMALSAVTSGQHAIRITLHDGQNLKFDLAPRILRVGLPAALEQFILRGGQLQFARVVSSLGTAIYAAHQISINLWSLSFVVGFAFAIAATAMVGQSLGARRPDWAERSAREASRLSMIVSGVIGFLCMALAPWLIRIYNSDPVIVSQGSIALRIMAIVQPAQAAAFVLAGALRGAGDTRWPLYATSVGVWGFRVALAELFVVHLGFGLPGAWAAMAIDQFVRTLVIMYRFNTGRWKKARV